MGIYRFGRRMFWRGEQDKEIKNRYHPMISLKIPAAVWKRFRLKSRSGTGECPFWIISSNRLRMEGSLSLASGTI